MPETLNCVEESVAAKLELAGGVHQTDGGTFTVGLDLAQAGANFVLRDRTVGSEIDETFFLDVELLHAFGELRVHRVNVGLLGTESRFESCLYFIDEVIRETEGAVVADNRLLDFGHRKVWEVAEALLTASAQVVLVGTTPTLHGGVDEA